MYRNPFSRRGQEDPANLYGIAVDEGSETALETSIKIMTGNMVERVDERGAIRRGKAHRE